MVVLAGSELGKFFWVCVCELETEWSEELGDEDNCEELARERKSFCDKEQKELVGFRFYPGLSDINHTYLL